MTACEDLICVYFTANILDIRKYLYGVCDKGTLGPNVSADICRDPRNI